MIIKHKELAVAALRHARGDDGARVRRAFAGMSQAELNTEYGESGQTCAQILEGYAARDAMYDAAIEWVRTRD